MWTISGWPGGRPLTAKIRADGLRVGGVGGEAVHGLGRDGDEPAGAQSRDAREPDVAS